MHPCTFSKPILVLPSFLPNVKNQTTSFDLGTFRPHVRRFIHDVTSPTDIPISELRGNRGSEVVLNHYSKTSGGCVAQGNLP